MAENIALTMALDGDPNCAPVWACGKSTACGGVFFDPWTKRRKPEPLTYADFAAIGAGTMDEFAGPPGQHRLSRDLLCLGCSARWHKDYSGLDMFYSVQVFFAPQAERSGQLKPSR